MRSVPFVMTAIPKLLLIFLVLPWALVTGSCGESALPGSTLVRDSAGVTIVENPAPTWPDDAGWSLSPEPMLDLGAADAPREYGFQSISDVLALDGNGFVVADRGRGELLFYDPAGGHQRTVGGQGGGPGEFRNLGVLDQKGDSVLAYDWREARLTIFDTNGELLGTVELEQTDDERHPIHTLNLAGVFEDKLVLSPWVVMPLGRPDVGAYWDSASVRLYDVAGGYHGVVGEPYRTEMFVGVQGSMGRPFGARSQVAVDDLLFIGEGKTYEIRGYDLEEGALSRIIRRRWDPRPVDAEAFELLLDYTLRRAGATSRQDSRVAGLRRALESAPLPDRMPAFSSLLVDSRGNLWVRDYQPPYENEPERWSVFDEEGAWLGDLTMPERFRILRVVDDLVLGVYRDSLDVQHFRVYRLLTGAEDPANGTDA